MNVCNRISLRCALTLTLACLGTARAEPPTDAESRLAEARVSPTVRMIQVGPRPYYLIEGMDRSALKYQLQQCSEKPVRRTDFSIAHRGAPLQFPEHTKEAYQAGARMGAGVVECDVTFTRDGELVCRHDECDLHTTTNIVDTELNSSCTVPYAGPGSSPTCCTSDLTLAQFRTLKGKMDASNPAAPDAKGYLGGTPDFRTDLYTGRGTLMTLKDSIALNKRLGVKHTPELKAADPTRVAQVFGSQQQYAQKMLDIYRQAGVEPRDVWPQSFNLEDIRYWIAHEPAFARQAVYLDDVDPGAGIPRLTLEELKALKAEGVVIFAPPIPALLTVTQGGDIVPSQYARDIKAAGLDIITWSFERADLRAGASKAGFYYAFDPEGRAIRKDADMYKALDVLARDIKVRGVFSDWPGTVSYYASCMGLK